MDFTGKNVIIFGACSVNNEIQLMGSLFDSIEYFVEIYKYNKDVHLLINIFPLTIPTNNLDIIRQIKELIVLKYNYTDLSFFDNIHSIRFKEIFLRTHFNKVAVFDLGSPKLFKQFILRCNEVYVVSELTDKEHFYESKFNKVLYFTEMPFCYSDIPYKIKMAFKHFRQYQTISDNLYINYPRAQPTQQVLDIVSQHNKPLLVKDNNSYFDLHRHFNEYIYFQSPYWFDTHPRLFHECKFYDKPYHYYNFDNVKDGSYYRYHDSLTEQLSSRELTRDDEIVMRMI